MIWKVVPNDSQKRIALTEEQQEIWMNFIKNDKTYSKYYVEKTKIESGIRYIPMTKIVDFGQRGERKQQEKSS